VCLYIYMPPHFPHLIVVLVTPAPPGLLQHQLRLQNSPHLSLPHCPLSDLAFSDQIALLFQWCTRRRNLSRYRLHLPGLTIIPPKCIVILISPTSQSCPRHPDFTHHCPPQLHSHPTTLASPQPRRHSHRAHTTLTLPSVA
jgi:hypothetical protein